MLRNDCSFEIHKVLLITTFIPQISKLIFSLTSDTYIAKVQINIQILMQECMITDRDNTLLQGHLINTSSYEKYIYTPTMWDHSSVPLQL